MCLLLHLQTLINIIINMYLKADTCAFLITQNSSFYYRGTFQVVSIRLPEENDIRNLKKVFHFGCQIFILQVNEPSLLITNIEDHIKLQPQRFNNRKYLIIPTEYSTNLDKVLTNRALHFVPDVLVAVPEVNYGITLNYSQCEIVFRLITHRFVGKSGNDDAVTLDYWYSQNGSFLLNNKLFWNKLTNLQGRSCKMATFNYKPYAIIGSTMATTDGTEMRIALEYAKKVNCSIEFVVDDISEWGEIYDNWTGNGILGNVAMDYADMGYGALYTWYHEYAFLDLSMPVVRTGITCLAPTPRLLAGWLSPFFPFNLIMWISVMASFIIAVLSYAFVLYFNYRQRLREKDPDLKDVQDKFIIFYMMVRIFLLQSWPTIRSLEKPPIRCLLTAILIFSLLIGTCYNSGLASSMTLPRFEKAIRTVQDLADSDMSWGATHEAWVFSIESATQPTIVKILHNFKILNENQLRKRIRTRDYAFSVERLPFGHFAIGNYIQNADVPQLLLMTEDIYWEQCVFMTRKNSPYLPSLNLLILQIHAAGLSYIWETQVALHYLDYNVQVGVKFLSMQHHGDHGPVRLSFRHIQGLFIIWFLGLIIAFITFLRELYIFKHVTKLYK